MKTRPGTTRWVRRCGAAAALGPALALLVGAQPAPPPPVSAPDAVPPATGRFLVATEQIRGSLFQHSVVFLLRYAPKGALGLIVNRPTDVGLDSVIERAGSAAGTLYVGGPVARTEMMVLVRHDTPPSRAQHVAGDVFLTVDEKILHDTSRARDAGQRLRVYVGHAGWTDGQLDREIARGDWLVVAAPTDAIFDTAPDGLWRKLFEAHHRLVASAPGAGRLASPLDLDPLPGA